MNRYALKEALIYTAMVSMILLMPLYLYYTYTVSIYETKNELSLRRQAKIILHAMEQYDVTTGAAFSYPRFISVTSGLYDANFAPIFTLIETPLPQWEVGYTQQKGMSYLVVKLPAGRFFDASYLVLSAPLSYWPIYQTMTFILILIATVVYILSLFFLRRFAKPYEEANAQLDNFIKDTVHEISTPLSIINTNVDLYRLKEGENRYFNRIKAASKTLANLYNDMDYLIKNENINFSQDTIDLSRVVAERIDYFDEVARQKEITLSSQIDPDIGILFNYSQLQRIIDNNLSNAIKYSHEGGRVIVQLFEKSNGEVVLSFQDFGIGIQYPHKIFKRYYREERNKGGFGIGLNIVKNIIDAAHIRLDIDSTLGQGSTFGYTFPAQMRTSITN